MASMVESTSASQKIQRLHHHLSSPDQNHREHFFVVDLVTGRAVNKMIKSQLENLTSVANWVFLPCTEEEASTAWRLNMRPAATAFQLIQQLLERYPLRLFKLLLPNPESERERLLAARACTLDEFSLHFRSTYNSHEALQSQEAWQVLCAFASVTRGNTFSTEVLHSRNARRCRTRFHTHTMDLCTLALQHCATSCPPWLEMLLAKDDIEVGAANPEKSEDTVRSFVLEL
eukprot:6492213-Amphidinium_carterae.1